MIHRELAAGRWYQFSFSEQLANIGADVGRTIKWKNKGHLDFSREALRRALELLGLSLSDPKNQNHRIKELTIVREALIDYFEGSNIYKSTDEAWENYFMYFNWIAARERGK